MTTDTLETIATVDATVKDEDQPQPETQTEIKPVETEAKAEPEAKAEDKVEQEIEKETHDIRRMKKFMRRAAEAEAKYEALQAQLQPQTPVDNTPKREQYPDDQSYLAAMVQHEVSKVVPVLHQQIQQAQIAEQAKASIAEVRRLHEDYDTVMEDANSIAIPPAAAEALRSSPMLEHLRYHLATHPEVIDRLYNLPPVRVASEIGKLEAEIERGLTTAKAPVERKVSNARPPITPVKLQGDSGKVDESKLSDQEWFKRDMARRINATKGR
jgi:hypothetical protein